MNAANISCLELYTPNANINIGLFYIFLVNLQVTISKNNLSHTFFLMCIHFCFRVGIVGRYTYCDERPTSWWNLVILNLFWNRISRAFWTCNRFFCFLPYSGQVCTNVGNRHIFGVTTALAAKKLLNPKSLWNVRNCLGFQESINAFRIA